MSFTINTNVSARIAGLYSGRADSAIGKSITRLSSGKKILNPADDAGGLAVALKIDSQRACLEASALNAQNAISYLQVQDGALQTIYSLEPRPDEILEGFAAYKKFRTEPLNLDRERSACLGSTCAKDVAVATRMLGWLKTVKGVVPKTVPHVFASAKIAPATKAFVEHLVQERGVRYRTVEGYVSSVLNVARFAHEARQRTLGKPVDRSQLESLGALLRQCGVQARKQDLFDKTTPATWLSWHECNMARVHAEKAVAACEHRGEAVTLTALSDRLVLSLLTWHPPGRVGEYRLLRIGTTLQRGASGGWQLVLETPDAHKTAATFGPSRTTLCAPIVAPLEAYLKAAGLLDSQTAPPHPFVFSAGSDVSQPPSPSAWTRLVQATFHRHAGVKLAPKEVRSAFVTWLRSSKQSDETLRAAALALRHSSKMQKSAAYDKGSSDQLIAAAVDVTRAFAASVST